MSTDIEKRFRKIQNGNDVRGAAIATDTEKKTLTPELVAFIASAFSSFLAERYDMDKSDLRIGIGHDSRLTADMMVEATAKGLSGCSVYDCGLITTPAMFQSVLLPESGFDGSVMITASHLPFNRNGMKFFTKEGALSHAELDSILDTAIELAHEYAVDGEELSIPDEWMDSSEKYDMAGLYAGMMRKLICDAVAADDYEHPLSGLHIVVDSGNGASGFFATDILEKLGADISGSQFLEPDGNFPAHVPNPENKEAMESVRKAVVESGADLGVIFDCDGDRGAVVLSDGTEVNRNTLIALLSVIVSEDAPGSTVVTDSVTSDELAVFLEGLGMKHYRYRRGYKNVIDKGVELNEAGERCELAIETSGHGAFKENHFSDDGAYIAVKIICKMAVLGKEGKKIGDLIKDLGQPAESREVRFTLLPEDFRPYGENILKEFRSYCESDPVLSVVEPNHEGVRVNYDIDGKKGWVLLRMSLHDPVMPLNLESSNEGGCDAVWEHMMTFWSRFDGWKW